MSDAPFAQQLDILHSLLDSMDDAVVVVDADGRFVLRNQAAERIARIGAQVTNLTEWANEAGLPGAHLPLTRALRGERVDSEELFLRPTEQAAGVWLSVTARPLNGGAIVVLRDVTAHKKSVEALRQSEQRFATFMRHLPGVAFIKDRDGRYIFYNEAVEGVMADLGPSQPGQDRRRHLAAGVCRFVQEE